MRKTIAALLCIVMIFVFSGISYAKEEKISIDENYSEYFSVDHIFYEKDGYDINSIVDNLKLYNFSTYSESAEQKIYSYSNEIISSSVGNENVVFFASGNSIYRIHLQTKTVDKILEENNIVWFYPLSDYQIMYAKSENISTAKSWENQAGIMCSTDVSKDLEYFVYNSFYEETYAVGDPQS